MPTFPDNIVVFPDRDMVSAEGFVGHIGETVTVEVHRAGVGIIGSAHTEVEAGDHAFEINHPGGACWGAGTGLNVTPDIKHGDEVFVKFDDGTGGDIKLQDVYVTDGPVRDGNTITIKGHIPTDFPLERMEQRIVEPALKDTAVGRRDARAVAGSGGDDGYISSLTRDGTVWTAEYTFDELAAAEIAENAGAGVRALSWQVTDVDGNRQGITINEFGEVGGPGMGGCPNGPLASGPAAPSAIEAIPSEDGKSIKVAWTPAKAIPGTPDIEGYRVHAVSEAVNGEADEIGKHLHGVDSKGTTLTGLDPLKSYTVRVVSLSSAGETFPAATAAPMRDAEAPTASAKLEGSSTELPNEVAFATAQNVVLSSNDSNAQVYYTLDNAQVFDSAGGPTSTAKAYKDPVLIAESTTLTFAAIDAAGNQSAERTIKITVTNDPVPAKPAAPTAVAGAEAGTAVVSWEAPDAGAPGLTITEYSIQAYTAGGPAGAAKKVGGDVTETPLTGLSGDTVYTFTVTASNTHGPSLESDKSAPLTVPGALVADAGADQSIVRKTTASTVTLDGSKSTKTGATYAWTQTGGRTVTLSDRSAASPTFSLPTVGAQTTQADLAKINDPLVFTLTVTSGDQTRTDVVKVTPIPDRITVARAQWKSRDFRIEGTASTVGATVTVYRANATTGALTRISGATVTAAAAPETGGVWSVRLRDNAAGTNPGTIYVVSNLGGTTSASVTAG